MKALKLISVVLSVMMLTAVPTSITSYATDTNDDSVVLIEEEDSNYSKAIEVLGLTEEEAKECNIYSVDSESISNARGITIPNDSGYYAFDRFDFSGTNTGAYWTCQGSELKWGFEWTSLNGTNVSAQYLHVSLSQYPAQDAGDIISQSGYCYNESGFTSSWISCNRCDHRFYYTTGYTGVYETSHARVRMYVATRN